LSSAANLMDVSIYGHNLEITPHMRDYIEKKMRRLDRHLPTVAEARVDLTVENTRSADSRQVAQVTVRNERGVLLRAEERSGDMFASIDAVMDKMSRQIERYKGKRVDRRRGAIAAEPTASTAELEDVEALEEEEAEPAQIVRRKRFIIQPMTEEEAVEQLELLGHDFFIFYNAEAAQINVVYRRKGGGYGLLQPELG